MFSIGERSRLQAGQFSTRTLLLWSHAVVIASVCGFALSCWNTRHLEGSICCSKTFIYLSAFISAFQNMQAANTVCTYAQPPPPPHFFPRGLVHRWMLNNKPLIWLYFKRRINKNKWINYCSSKRQNKRSCAGQVDQVWFNSLKVSEGGNFL